MKTPYEELDVTIDANDIEIKQAYLQKVKDNPPDRDQKQFHLIHNAYLAIKDHKSRLNHDLFTLPTINFDQIIDQALFAEQILTLTPEIFNELLRVSIDQSTLLKVVASPEKQ